MMTKKSIVKQRYLNREREIIICNIRGKYAQTVPQHHRILDHQLLKKQANRED